MTVSLSFLTVRRSRRAISTMMKSALPNEIQQVEILPYPIVDGSHFRLLTNRASPAYTHYLFRFPAKFHAPIIKWVLRHYMPENGLVLDPFNGSGTLQVEALAAGLNSIGLDIDLVATHIARAKTRPLCPTDLRASIKVILSELASYRRPVEEYKRRMFEDLSEHEFLEAKQGLEVPAIPNIGHWFRRYVIVDLAHLRDVIENVDIPTEARRFFLAVFAAIIRRCSNADPVPVSGLEYTKEMRRRDKEGRYIDPFALFEQRAERAIRGMTDLWESLGTAPRNWAVVHHGNVQTLDVEIGRIRERHNVRDAIDAVITSPPYCSAVDYHTRHKLEAYWLRQVRNQNEYLKWYHHYVGRRRILLKDRDSYAPFSIDELDNLIGTLRKGREKRAAAMYNYFASLDDSLRQIAQVLRPEGTFVMFIGNSITGNHEIDTHSFAKEFASRYLEYRMEFSYEVRNRYMRYTRHNGADISTEWVMIFTKPG
jgi:DNA modification methylase